MSSRPDTCALCGASTIDRRWFILNRWAIGTGRGRCMVEAVNDEGEYVWEIHPDSLEADERASGKLLCWPDCLVAWVEGKMIETDFELGLR